MRRWLLACALVLAFLCGAAQAGAAPESPGRQAASAAAPTRASVLTMGPGDHPFASFGHTAILLEWRGKTRVYNFGTFQFDGVRGVQDFLEGKFRYWLSVSTLPATLAHYRAENRSLIAQDLDLTPSERLSLARALERNALPEHREYDYDYFKDNCTTRVRDAVDGVLGGAIARDLTSPGRLTYRQHAARLSAPKPSLYVALDAVLGRPTDRVPNRFEELWVPDTLAHALGEVTLERAEGRRPLVARTRVLLEADRAGPRWDPPRRALGFGAVGLALGGVGAALGFLAARTRPRLGRLAFGTLTALLGAVAGLLATVFVGFSLTKHWAAHENYNVLVFGPWSLGLLWMGLRLARGSGSAERSTRLLLGACATLALVGTLLPLLLGDQDNLRLGALMVPLWGGLLLGADALHRSSLAQRP